MNLLTVLKTGGEYTERHVAWLRGQVYQNIFCITDSTQEMQGVISIPMRYNWPGWWAKMEMFNPIISGDFLYCDLDTVFLDGVPEWNLHETTVLSDMYGQKHINSGLMYMTHKDRCDIWRHWITSPDEHIAYTPGGDQFLLDKYWRDKPRFQTLFPGEAVSYKADIQQRGFDGREKVVVFHGQPRPWGCGESWVKPL